MVYNHRAKFLAFAGIAAFFSSFSSLGAEPFLRIVQPYENAALPYVTQSFVFGSVLPATASLTINGVPVTPHTNGGFLAMIPFSEGRFRIEAVASDGVTSTTVTREVVVGHGPEDFPVDYSKIEPISPKGRVVVRSGDMISVTFQGARSGKASFRMAGKNELPMLETATGTYRGIYKIQPGDTFDDDDIMLFLKRGDGKKISQKAGAKITVQRRALPRFVELKDDAILLTGPGSNYGYQMFLLKGVRLEVTGEWGDFVRVSLEKASTQGWVKKSLIVELPLGTPPARSIARNIRIDVKGTSTVLEIPLQFVHPHRVEQRVDPHRLRLTVYGVVADTDRIRFKSQQTVVNEVVWSQPTPGVYVLDIDTKQKHPWGYDVRYEGTTLVMEIRHRPVMNLNRTNTPLRGLKVALDAGHTKENFGTIGPWGNTEASVVLAAAKVAKQMLEAKGAQVVMIQDGTKEISLQDRVDLAWKERADLFISLHADACPEGQNPRDTEGHSVHYYHPQSRWLAEIIHDKYGQKSKFTDQGVWRSNLAVCRITQMPSLLFEQGFLMLPEVEEIFLTKKHQDMVATVLFESIVEFAKRAQ